jgi:hypothetical protein
MKYTNRPKIVKTPTRLPEKYFRRRVVFLTSEVYYRGRLPQLYTQPRPPQAAPPPKSLKKPTPACGGNSLSRRQSSVDQEKKNAAGSPLAPSSPLRRVASHPPQVAGNKEL